MRKLLVLTLALLSSACSAPFMAQNNPEVRVSWTAIAKAQEGFVIDVSTDGSNYSTIQTVPDGTTSILVRSLPAGQTYFFRVHAYNSLGDSAFSQIVSLSL